MSARLCAFGAIVATVTLITTPVSADHGAAHAGRPLAAELSGANEVPPNESPATGDATFTVNHGQGEVCWDFSFSGLTSDATAAHIHAAPAGVNGDVVIPTPVPAVTTGSAQGCAAVDRSLAKDIKADPGSYYLNIHTSEFPGGEIRGQLHR